MLSTPPSRLCILRLSAIGDTCHTLPVVRSLQAHWPSTRITWIIGRTEAALLGDIPDIEFIIFNKRDGLAGVRRLWRQLADQKFDALLDMQVALRASIASLGVKAPIRLGFDRARARDFQWLFTNQRIAARPREHVMDALFGFAETLGVTQRVLRWDIPVPQAAAQFAREQTAGGAPVMLISPCSSQRARNYRNWRPENYAAIVDYARQRYGMHSILTGGPSLLERDYGARISEQVAGKVTNLIGKTSLKQLYALIQASTVVLCPDSGPVHMATAAGTPVIGLYASSNPDRTGPYLERQWTVNRYPDALAREGLDIDSVRWGQRVRDPATMNLISVGDVAEKLDALMLSGHAQRNRNED